MKVSGKKILVLAVAAIVSGQAAAYEAGDWIVRAGYAAVDPRDNSDALTVAGSKLNGTGVGVDGAAALGITASYMITPHWGVELLAATPFKHNITAKGLGGLGVPDGARIGSVKHLPPTVSVQYYFAPSNSAWQPYAGLGLNYTKFFGESLSSDAKSKLGASNLHLSDSVGLAGEVGIDWRANQHWLVNASVWRAQIKSDASLNTSLGRVKTTVAINPWVYMLSVGYKF